MFRPMGLYRRVAERFSNNEDNAKQSSWPALLGCIVLLLIVGFFVSIIVMVVSQH